MLLCLLVFVKFSAFSEEKTINVGWYIQSKYQEITDSGSPFGFNYDYLQEISEYTDWKYNFILDSFDNCMEMLENGKILVWFIMFSAWGSDTFAYLTGKYLGKHKFSKISPNKTIEGCIGGLLGSIILCLIYAIIVNNAFGLNLVYWQVVITAIVLSIIGQIGDFAASAIKRHFEVKDFSNLFPGHGGMIDRIDSIIFIAPFAYYIFVILLG